MRQIKQIVLLFFCLLISAMSFADDKITVASTDADGNTFYIYTRSGVTNDSWQSFCLPMDIDINDLQTYFDKIYIAYSGEELESYSDIDDAFDEELGSKRMNAMRKTEDASNTLTAKSEAYGEEAGYGTDEEDSEDASIRYCFAYSADDSKYYHYYIADFTNEEEIIIPQGMPFFAHVKSEASITDGNLTINGHIWDGDEIYDDIIIETEFNVYKDKELTELDYDKNFATIGVLATDMAEEYDGTLFNIDSTTGNFIAMTSDVLEKYHAYLLGLDASGILIYPKTCEELENIEVPIDAEDPQPILSLTDSTPTLVAGTYNAGNVTYTRTGSYIIDGNYNSFCLPFDFNVADAPCFNKVYIPIHVAFYNTSTEKLKIFLVNQSGTIAAGTPFIARLTGEAINLTNANPVTYDGTATNPDERELTVFDNDGTSSVLTSNEAIKLYWGGTLTSTPTKDGMNTFNLDGSFGPRTSTSNLSPFRAYLIETTTNSSVKVSEIEVVYEDEESTGIENLRIEDNSKVNVYNINGMLIRKNVNVLTALDGLHPGLYIVNGNKIIKE